MTKKEKKLLTIFLAILTVGLVFKGVPAAVTLYKEGNEAVDELKQKRSRLMRLLERQDYWAGEYEKNNKREQELTKQLFVGESTQLIANRLQSKLKQLAKNSGVKVDSLKLPDFTYSGNWLLISQTISFKASTQNFVKLLDLIKKSNPKLVIKDIKLRAHRKKLSGTVIVIGFSRQVEGEQGKES